MTTLTLNDVPHLLQWVQKMNLPFTVFDLETTGFHRENDRIVEVGMLTLHPSGRITHAERLINPEKLIPKVASDIHGITNSMVIDAPNFHQIALFFQDAFKNNIIGGFNTRQFDVGMLMGNAKVYGYHYETPKHQVDLRDIWKKLSDSSAGKLGDLAEHFNVEAGTAHRALGDVETTIRVYERILELHGDQLFIDIFNGQYKTPKETKSDQMKVRIFDGLHNAIVEHGCISEDILAQIAETLQIKESDVSFAVSDYMKKNPDHIHFFKNADIQNTIHGHVKNYCQGQVNVKLKPLKEWLMSTHALDIDYTQIRVALHELEREMAQINKGEKPHV